MAACFGGESANPLAEGGVPRRGAGGEGTASDLERIYAARASICDSDAVETAGLQPDCDPDVGAGDWRDCGSLQPDPGRAADTAAVQGTGAVGAPSRGADGRPEDGRPA